MNAFRFARAPRGRLTLLAFALAVAAGLACWALGSRAQETELHSVPADSVSGAFPGDEGVEGEERDIILPNHVHIKAGKDDVVQVGQDIVIERDQHVLGHVLALNGNVTVRGTVDDDVVAMGGDVVIEDGAQVRGDAVSVGGKVTRGAGATVLGSTVSVGGIPRALFTLSALNGLGHGIKFFQAILNLLFFAFVAWLVVLLTSHRTARIVASVQAAPLASVGWGLLALVGIVPATLAVCIVALLLVVTIIGIPVAVLAVLGYILGLVLLGLWGAIVGSVAVGEWVVRRLAPRLGTPSLTRNALVGVATVMAPGLLGNLFQAFGPIVSPAMLLGEALEMAGCLLFLGAAFAGVGGILRARAGQPAPLPGAYPSAPVTPRMPSPPAIPGTGVPEAPPPTA